MINSLQNLSEAEFEVPSVSLHTCLQPFSNPQNCFINGVLGETVPYLLQDIFEFSFCLGLRSVLLIGSKHHTLDAKIHRIKIWGVWRPFILSDEIGAIIRQPLLCLTRGMSGSAILLKYEVVLQQIVTVLQKQWK